MPPAISVVIPVHNAAGTVRRAIASIQAQTFRDWELIAVDDGSSDASADIIDALTREDPRIHLLRGPHRGIVAALNAGLIAAQAPLLARMDADDESHPERLAAQEARMRHEPDLGLVSCLVDYGGDRTTGQGYALHVDWINSLVTPDDLARNRFVESPLAHPSVMLRRATLDRVGHYRDGDFPEDYELWLRLLDAGVRMAKVPRVLLRWNDPPTRLSRTDVRYYPDAFFRLKAKWLARHLLRHGIRATTEPVVADRELGPSTPAGLSDGPNRRVWIWGAGRPTRKRAAHLTAHGIALSGFIDIDPKKTGRNIGGLPVVPATELPAASGSFVLGYVSSRGARELIRAALIAGGYVEARDFLMCA